MIFSITPGRHLDRLFVPVSSANSLSLQIYLNDLEQILTEYEDFFLEKWIKFQALS